MRCHGQGHKEGTQLQCLCSHSTTLVISKKWLCVKELSEPKNIAKATWCWVLGFSMVHICDQWCTHLFAVFWECATPPHIHPTSRYVIACDQFYQAFPTLVLQATNVGVGRPGYEARASERTPVRRVWWVTQPCHGSTAAFLPQCWWWKECHIDRPDL